MSNDALELPPETENFYRSAIQTLQEGGVPFLVGGAYAFCEYTGIVRHTKDLDIFLRPRDLDAALECFRSERFTPEKTFPHWLAKVYCGEDCVDLIYRAGNGMCEVDDEWFKRAPRQTVLGESALLCAPEGIVWMKSFIMERERFDGADVAHLIHSCAERMDWEYLARSFGSHWRVLLSHLVLFGFIYPGERLRVPRSLMDDLLARLRAEMDANATERTCRGTLLSRAQYLPDVQERGYRDPRLDERVQMSPGDVENWTAAIEPKDRPSAV